MNPVRRNESRQGSADRGSERITRALYPNKWMVFPRTAPRSALVSLSVSCPCFRKFVGQGRGLRRSLRPPAASSVRSQTRSGKNTTKIDPIFGASLKTGTGGLRGRRRPRACPTVHSQALTPESSPSDSSTDSIFCCEAGWGATSGRRHTGSINPMRASANFTGPGLVSIKLISMSC